MMRKGNIITKRRITQVLRFLGVEFVGPQPELYTLKSPKSIGKTVEVLSSTEELNPGVKSRVVTINRPIDFNGHKISCPSIKYELIELGNPQDLDYALIELPIEYRNDVVRKRLLVRVFSNGKSITNVVLHNEIMRQLVIFGQELLQKNYRLVSSSTVPV